MAPQGNPGLYANIHAKRARGEKMRSPGDKGAPTDKAFRDSARTADTVKHSTRTKSKLLEEMKKRRLGK